MPNKSSKSKNNLIDILHNLIHINDKSIEIIKHNLIEEYHPESVTDFMIISQIIDIFVRLNRLQFHLKYTVVTNINAKYREKYQIDIDKDIDEYSLNLEKELQDNLQEELNNENNSDNNIFFDWKTYKNNIINKRLELEQKYGIEQVDESNLQYFVEQDNYRKEEYHLINCLIKLIEIIEKRKQEKYNHKMKIALIQAEIKAKKIYDY